MTISPSQIGMARILMENGSSMKDAAITLGVRSCDLDLGLWVNIGTPLDDLLASRPRRVKRKTYAPDF